MKNGYKYRGKRLLVLGGAAQCCKVVEAAKEMGVYTIVADRLPNGPAKRIADEQLDISVTDADAILGWCKAHPVDGVLNFCIDFAQITHERVCRELHLPCFGTAEQYRCLTDKAAFKKMCVENGVDVIPEYDEGDLDRVEYPVLVKPAESSGSRGSAICRNHQELSAAIEYARKESRNGRVLIERYMDGFPDFSVSYIIVDGEPYLSRTLDRFLGRAEDHLQRQCICGRSPSIYTELYLEKAHQNVVAMLKRMGLRNAPVFMQGFIDGEKFRFYDPGLRFSGAEYERMLKSATGIDVVKAFVAYALGASLTPLAKELDQAYRLKGFCGLQILIDSFPGTIAAVFGVEEVASLPAVVTIQQKHDPGYVVPDSGDVKQRIFEIVTLTENDKESITKAVDSIAEHLSIRAQDGTEMMTPIVEISRLFGCHI